MLSRDILRATEARPIPRRTEGSPEWQRLLRAPWLAPRITPATPHQARDLYLAGLISARAMESESIGLLSHQIDLLSYRPATLDALRRHLGETEFQYERLGVLLMEMGVSTPPEGVTEAQARIAGPESAVSVDAGELLKMAISIHGFEHREAAFYHALLQLARLARHDHGAELLQRSLQEEERMAAWAQDDLHDLVQAVDGPADRAGLCPEPTLTIPRTQLERKSP